MRLPDTFNDDNNVVALFNIVIPDTFRDEIKVVILFNVVVPETSAKHSMSWSNASACLARSRV